MAGWFKRWSNFDSARSLGEWIWWGVSRLFVLFGFPGAAVIAWLVTYWEWYWTTFNLAGFAFAFLFAAILLPFAAILAAKARNLWTENKNLSEAIREQGAQLNSSDRNESDKLEGYVEADKFDALCNIVSGHYQDFDKRFFIASQNLGGLIERVDAIDAFLKTTEQPSGGLSRLGQPAEAEPKNRFDSLEMKIKRDIDYNYGAIESLKEIVARFQLDFLEFRKGHGIFMDHVRGLFLADRVLDSFSSLNLRADALECKLCEPWNKKHLYGKWSNWRSDFALYKSRIENICRFLKINSDIDISDILNAPGEKYRADHWPNSFGDLNEIQKHDYQTFRIIAENYRSARTSVTSELTNKLHANI